MRTAGTRGSISLRNLSDVVQNWKPPKPARSPGMRTQKGLFTSQRLVAEVLGQTPAGEGCVGETERASTGERPGEGRPGDRTRESVRRHLVFSKEMTHHAGPCQDPQKTFCTCSLVSFPSPWPLHPLPHTNPVPNHQLQRSVTSGYLGEEMWVCRSDSHVPRDLCVP